jgi:hypothetical protein
MVLTSLSVPLHFQLPPMRQRLLGAVPLVRYVAQSWLLLVAILTCAVRV